MHFARAAEIDDALAGEGNEIPRTASSHRFLAEDRIAIARHLLLRFFDGGLDSGEIQIIRDFHVRARGFYRDVLARWHLMAIARNASCMDISVDPMDER